MKNSTRDYLFWFASGLPALAAAAASVYRQQLWIRVVCLCLLAGFIFVTGFSIGWLYLQALGFTFLAAALQMNRQQAASIPAR